MKTLQCMLCEDLLRALASVVTRDTVTTLSSCPFNIATAMTTCPSDSPTVYLSCSKPITTTEELEEGSGGGGGGREGGREVGFMKTVHIEDRWNGSSTKSEKVPLMDH